RILALCDLDLSCGSQVANMVNTYCGDAPSYSPGSEAITSTKPDFGTFNAFYSEPPYSWKAQTRLTQ
ncbi:MAG TPA: hypothetical protein VN952_09250, partial [Chthoniobacterales bacterium]|nr:hypothetical protein [Chthoniobacterales bacterium]